MSTTDRSRFRSRWAMPAFCLGLAYLGGAELSEVVLHSVVKVA